MPVLNLLEKLGAVCHRHPKSVGFGVFGVGKNNGGFGFGFVRPVVDVALGDIPKVYPLATL